MYKLVIDNDGKVNALPLNSKIESNVTISKSDWDIYSTYTGNKIVDDTFIPGTPPVNPRIEEIKQLLQANDIASVRPLRAKVAGTATDTDTTRLLELESEAAILRQELASLTNQS